MKLVASAVLAALLTISAASAPASNSSNLKLERVVMLMRHGIRPPTKAQPIPAGYTTETWPTWPVAPGLLTQRGAAGVLLLGNDDRVYFQQRGLVAAGCPKQGEVVLKASSKPRAVNTAESWAQGFMPGCAATVSHPAEDEADPIFHGLDDEPAWFDGQRALGEALALAPRGGLAEETGRYKPELKSLARVLGCASPSCELLKEPSTLVAVAHNRPEIEGPLDVGSTASQTFLLEYLEGMPMKSVGWGRVSRAQIEQMLRFHPLKFKYSNRPDYVARHAGAPIAREIVKAFTGSADSKLTLLAGHDTNIADLGGFLKMHWHVPSYPADDVPPGSALGFELLRSEGGNRFVRAFYRSQTMDQLRTQQELGETHHAFRQYLPIPGCGDSAAPRACTLPAFVNLVQSRALP